MNKIPILIVLLFSFVIASCNKNESSAVPNSNVATANSNKTAVVDEKPLEKISGNPLSVAEISEVKDFAVSDMLRTSDNTDDTGAYIRPFTHSNIFGSLKVEVKVGDKMTIVPLEVDVEPFEVAVSESERQIDQCTPEKNEAFWNIKSENITAAEILNAKSPPELKDEMPFYVMVIFPKVSYAKQIKVAQITKEMLPENADPQNILAAVDLDKDDQPDLIVINFCCSSSISVARDKSKDCSVCSRSFHKKNGKWVLASDEMPC